MSVNRPNFSGGRFTNSRAHATTQRVVDEHFAEEQPHLLTLPALPYDAVLTIERRISQEGMVEGCYSRPRNFLPPYLGFWRHLLLGQTTATDHVT